MTEIWDQECGLQANPTNTHIWAQDANLNINLPDDLQSIWTPTMNILGTRTQIAFIYGGAALNLGDPEEDDQPKVIEDLTRLQETPGPDENRNFVWGGYR